MAHVSSKKPFNGPRPTQIKLLGKTKENNLLPNEEGVDDLPYMQSNYVFYPRANSIKMG